MYEIRMNKEEDLYFVMSKGRIEYVTVVKEEAEKVLQQKLHKEDYIEADYEDK